MSDWAPPGTSAGQPAPPAPAGVPPAAAAVGAGTERPGPRATLPPPPLPLRPMTIPDLLDGAFAILERRPRDVLTIAAAFVIPIEMITVVALRDVLDSGAFSGVGDPSALVDLGGEGAQASGVVAAFSTFVIGTASLALLTGALTAMVTGWFRGVDVPPLEAIVCALRRSWALLAGVVVVHVLEAIGLIGLGIGAYLVMAALHVVSPVVVAEGAGPLRATSRSFRLTRSRFGVALIVPLLVGLIGVLVGFGFQTVPELVTVAVPDDWDWLVRSAGQILAELVVMPFTAGVAVLFYLDLRIRSEGFDIEQRTGELFDE